MSSVFEKRETIRFRDCDEAGRLKLSALLEMIQEVASDHMDDLGIGRVVLRAHGIAWIIARTFLDMQRMPRVDETIKMETFVNKYETLICPRYTVFYDANDELIGSSITHWIIVDIGEHRILRASALSGFSGVEALCNDFPEPTVCPNRLRLDEELSPAESRIIRNTDTDINGHLHNTRYADFVLDLLPHDVFLSRPVRSFDINYSKEIPEGAPLQMKSFSAPGLLEVRGVSGDVKIFEARLTY